MRVLRVLAYEYLPVAVIAKRAGLSIALAVRGLLALGSAAVERRLVTVPNSRDAPGTRQVYQWRKVPLTTPHKSTYDSKVSGSNRRTKSIS
jgi:hypothetical protein